jgi:DNA-binding CsgD family transcriptional regulator
MLGAGQRGMFELPGEATDTICALHPGGSFSEELLARSLVRAQEHLRRNVRMQVVHQTSALRHPSVATYLTELAAMGCRVRLRDSLPFRMLLIDQASAVCAVPTSGSYLLRGERVIVLLNRIFETTWVDATPLDRVLPVRASISAEPVDRPPVAQHQPLPLASTHEAVLRLLAEGHTDQSIARSMGITTRTVGRRISEIYHLLGVQSRFQAGIRARELGIV